jgi:CspA family cold shock protein
MPTGHNTAVFAMPVEDVFAIAGHGTVLTGVIAQGSINAGDIVQVMGGSSGLRLALAAIESDHILVEAAHAGDRVGLLFRTTDSSVFHTGMLVTGAASEVVDPMGERASMQVTGARRGVVKWYHPYDGVGFIRPDDGGDDVLFSELNLERADILSILPGQRVEFSSVEGERGPMALDIQEVADTPESVAPGNGWSAGRVKWFNPSEGIGFIVPDVGDNDVFVHTSSLEAEGLSTLVEGQRVEFRVFWGERGPMADRVRAAHLTPRAAAADGSSWIPSNNPERTRPQPSAKRSSSDVRYEGRDCTMTVTDDSILIVHKSMSARYLPIALSRLSSAHFEPATRWNAGILTIAADGHPIQIPTGTSVGGDPNTVVFKASSNDVFARVHAWLQQVIASNGF